LNKHLPKEEDIDMELEKNKFNVHKDDMLVHNKTKINSVE